MTGHALTIRLLGGFAVSVDGEPIPDAAWRRGAAARLIKLLALAADHRQHRDRVVNNLWPHLSARAGANNLYRALHIARRVLEPGLLSRAASIYVGFRNEVLILCPPVSGAVVSIDVEEFEATAQRARSTRDPQVYSAALALYGGPLLPVDPYDDWIIGRREQLHELYADVLRDAALTHEALGNTQTALDMLRKLVAAQPTDEDAHVALIRLLARTGRRDAALRQFELLRVALRQHLRTQPRQSTRALHRAVQANALVPRSRDDATGTLGLAPSIRNNVLASLTTFVGRDAEQAEIRALMEQSRLITLTGAGGCGKTRLALEVARRVAHSFRDGVCLVELAPVVDEELVPATVARRLGVTEVPGEPLTHTLADKLHNQHLLLVLDNCEHLVAVCASLATALLSTCPWLRVLATSRERLRCAGEQTWHVPPLLTPDPNLDLPLDALAQYDAIRLFVARARSAVPAFELTSDNAAAVRHITHGLEGIPLAIELAAARLQVLSVDEVAALLDDLLGLLAHGPRTAPLRHQAVRATLDWSYRMLDSAEQALLRSVSVFSGGFRRGAAEYVTLGHADLAGRALLDLLTSLIEKSLIVVDRAADGVRYDLLETVRQYGVERLRDAGDELATRHRHRDWCLQFAEDAVVALDGPDWTITLQRVDAEAANLQAALAGCQERGEIGPALQLAGALWRYWFLKGELTDCRRWLEGLMADPRSQAVENPVRVRASLGVGWFAFHQGDLATATARFSEHLDGDSAARAVALLGLGNVAEERGNFDSAEHHYRASLDLERQLGRQARVALVLDHLAQWGTASGNDEQALRLADESLTLRRSLGDELGTARALCNRGIALLHLGQLEAAESALIDSVALRRELGDALGLAMSTIWQGYVAVRHGGVERASALLAEGLTLARARGVMWGVIGGFLGMSLVLKERGEPERAAQMLGCSDAVVDSTSIVVKAGDVAFFDDVRQHLLDELGEAAFHSALQAGRAMPLAHAIEAALAVHTSPPSAPALARPLDRSGGPLTPRERQIAAMIESGDTNSQIATTLSLSRRTVDTHVSRILRKCGVSSRALLAAQKYAYARA